MADLIDRRADLSDDLKNAYYDGYDNGYNAGFEAGQRDVLLEKTQLSREDTTSDPISRQAAIDAGLWLCGRDTKMELINLCEASIADSEGRAGAILDYIGELEDLPSAQPTIYGYNIEHLELIARVLQKENLPPERIVEMLTDIGRIVAIVCDEFEETLRRAVEQCKI